MARDYVERGRGNKGKRPGAGKTGRKRAPARRSGARKPAARQGMPGWLWMLVGLSLGIVVAVVAYVLVGPRSDQPPADQASEQVPDQPEARQADTAPVIPPKQDARFTFYELLPSLELVPRNDTYVPGARSKKNVDYMIQAGSFADREDAETRRAQLILLGMEPTINKAVLGNGRTTYRVEVGPDDDFDRVKERMAVLIAEDIDVFFREVPRQD